eukprot:6184024-Pleurochrysis_carterae.AAC.1
MGCSRGHDGVRDRQTRLWSRLHRRVGARNRRCERLFEERSTVEAHASPNTSLPKSKHANMK